MCDYGIYRVRSIVLEEINMRLLRNDNLQELCHNVSRAPLSVLLSVRENKRYILRCFY